MSVYDDTETRTRKPILCLRCRYPVTWEQQRRQFGRLMRRGFDVAEAKPGATAVSEMHHGVPANGGSPPSTSYTS
jgi:hypothetical protein